MTQKKLKGLIFDIQRYCVHDGPGIRTTVFFKGCPLSCLWCSNPESQSSQVELAYFSSKCQQCGTCEACCPNNAIEMTSDGICITRQLCDMCGICVEKCNNSALRIVGQHLTVKEVLDEVLKDVPFYRKTNGGVTFSGGSPTMQHEFLLNLIKDCKKHGLHTALETEGFFDWKKVKEIFNYLDLVLYDIKVMQAEEYKNCTGVCIDTSLANLQKINDITDSEIIIRLPLIPGYTFLDSNKAQVMQILCKAKRVRQIHLLPFHQFGEEKYSRMGRAYQMRNVPELNEETIRPWQEYFENLGYIVRIGG